MKQFYTFLFALCFLSLVSCKVVKPDKNNGVMGSYKGQNRILDKANKDTEALEKRLRLAAQQVTMMKRDFEAYTKGFPNSTFTTYDTTNIRKLEEGYQELKKKVEELKQQYETMKKKLSKGFLVKTQLLTDKVFETNQLIDQYIADVKAHYGDYVGEKSSIADIRLPTNIFFQSGAFRVNYHYKNKIVEEYLKKIREIRDQERFRNLKKNQLYLFIKVIGYADGQPILNHQARTIISNACGIPYKSPQKKLNRCLSKLRAKSVASFISAKFKGYQITNYVDGKGDSEANGDTSNNPKLRKVDVSFRLSKIPLKKPSRD